jgi:hypothetical protein
MLLDMLLGPASHGMFDESGPGLLSSVNVSLNNLFKRVRRH